MPSEDVPGDVVRVADVEGLVRPRSTVGTGEAAPPPVGPDDVAGVPPEADGVVLVEAPPVVGVPEDGVDISPTTGVRGSGVATGLGIGVL